MSARSKTIALVIPYKFFKTNYNKQRHTKVLHNHDNIYAVGFYISVHGEGTVG